MSMFAAFARARATTRDARRSRVGVLANMDIERAREDVDVVVLCACKRGSMCDFERREVTAGDSGASVGRAAAKEASFARGRWIAQMSAT